MRSVRVKAGQSRRIAYFGDGDGRTLTFRAEALDDGPPRGKVEIKRRGALGYGYSSEFRPLAGEQDIKISSLAHQISVSVMAETDTVVTITHGVLGFGQLARRVAVVVGLVGVALGGTFLASKLGVLPGPDGVSTSSGNASQASVAVEAQR